MNERDVNSFVSEVSQDAIVAVQGLGFVGAVMALVVANAPGGDYAVLGVDLPTEEGKQKVTSLNEGTFPIKSADPVIEQLHERALQRGNFFATCDKMAYEVADIILVDVNLDVEKKTTATRELVDYGVDLEPFKTACRTIAKRCKPNVLVIVETTVPPGTCRKVVKPIFEKAFEERSLPKAYRIGHSYERVMPGPDYVESIRNFFRVYAGIDEESADATRDFLKSVINTDEYPLTRLGSTTASETAKVLENTYRAMNIAFVQEWTEFAEELGVNLYEVVEAIRKRPTHQNLMLPGLGVGGYCLTKDPLLASWARSNRCGSEQRLWQSECAVEINDQMPEHTFELVTKELDEKLSGKTVSLLGVSYRKDVADTRNTPAEYLYDLLQGKGAFIRLHDPFVRYWKEKELPVSQNLEEIIQSEVDAVIFSTPHSAYENNARLQHLLHSLPDGILIHDAWGVLSESEIGALQRRHRVRVTGRGDLDRQKDAFR